MFDVRCSMFFCLVSPFRFSILDFDLQDMTAISPPIAIRTPYKNIAQKLHLDLLKTRTPASFALSLARIETERARVQPALLGQLRLRKKFPDIIKRPDIHRGIRSRRFAQN